MKNRLEYLKWKSEELGLTLEERIEFQRLLNQENEEE